LQKSLGSSINNVSNQNKKGSHPLPNKIPLKESIKY